MTGGGAARVGRSDVRGLFALALSLFACATPVAPEGGPVDATPPRLVATSPEADAVGVAERTVRLTFSERIDARSAAQAVTVTPLAGPGEPQPTVEAAADELVVTLPALRDSTTYVVTVGTQLADRRGVRLPAPLTLAFATGPTLDRGRITGAVRQPTDGAGVAGLTVLAYRVLGDSLPDPRTARPDARTETGADGAFELGYLADVPHFVAALRDLNRNGRADDGEPFAAPPVPRLRPDLPAAPSAMPDALGAPRTAAPTLPAPLDLWLARRDTVPPRITGVEAVSNRRFRVRFSEGVALPGEFRWGVRQRVAPAEVVDSAAVAVRGQGTAYEVPGSPRELEVWTTAPLAPGAARLRVAARDSAGLGADLSPLFRVPARADTLVARVVRFEPAPPAPDSAAVLTPLFTNSAVDSEFPRVILSGPSDQPVQIVVRAEAERPDRPPLVFLDTARVTGTAVSLQGIHESSITSEFVPDQVEVTTAAGTTRATFQTLSDDVLGGVVGTVPVTAYGARAVPVVELLGADGVARRATVDLAKGQFHVRRLRPGTYAVRAWLDRQTGAPEAVGGGYNGRWDGGALASYAPPEKIVVLEPVEVRARWETEIDAALLAPLSDDAADAPPDR